MLKLLDREPTLVQVRAGQIGVTTTCAIAIYQAMYDAAPEVVQEPFGYVREIRPREWKFSKTTSWGPDIWAPVYRFPPDAQAEIAKRDERIESLTAAGAEYQRQCFEQSDRIKWLEQQIATLEFSWAGCSQQLKDACADLDAVEKQRDALAAQNQQLIGMIKQIIGHLNLYHLFSCVGGDSYDPECADLNIDQVQAIAHKALALTDLASPVLNRVKAEAMRR